MNSAPIWSLKAMPGDEHFQMPLRLIDFRTKELWSSQKIGIVDNAVLNGRKLTADDIPNASWFNLESGLLSETDIEYLLRSRDIFCIYSMLFLSEKVANRFRDSGLTGFALHKMSIYKRDKTEKYDFNFYFLEFSSKKDTVDRNNTDRCRPLYKNRPDAGYILPQDLAGRDVFVNHHASKGADIWFDPMIRHFQFASDAMAQLLIELRLQKSFNLNQCKFFEGNCEQ